MVRVPIPVQRRPVPESIPVLDVVLRAHHVQVARHGEHAVAVHAISRVRQIHTGTAALALHVVRDIIAPDLVMLQKPA